MPYYSNNIDILFAFLIKSKYFILISNEQKNHVMITFINIYLKVHEMVRYMTKLCQRPQSEIRMAM